MSSITIWRKNNSFKKKLLFIHFQNGNSDQVAKTDNPHLSDVVFQSVQHGVNGENKFTGLDISSYSMTL